MDFLIIDALSFPFLPFPFFIPDICLHCSIFVFFHFFVFFGDTTGTLYLQVAIRSLVMTLKRLVWITKASSLAWLLNL